MCCWILLLVLGLVAFGLGIVEPAMRIVAVVLFGAWLIGFERDTRHPGAPPFSRAHR